MEDARTYTFMGPDELHSRVLRELVNEVANHIWTAVAAWRSFRWLEKRNIKLCSAVDILEGRNDIQRDPDRLVGPCKHPEVQQGQVQIPAPVLGQSQTWIYVVNGLRADLWRRTWQCWWMQNSTWVSNMHLHSRKPTVSFITSKEVQIAGWRKWFSPSTLLSWVFTWTAFSYGVPAVQKTCGAVRVGPEEEGVHHT